MSKKEKKASCFVAKINLDLSSKLKADLENLGFSLGQAPYTLFTAKKKGISLSLFESGKLMVQGKEMGEFIEFYLEPEILGSFKFSHPEEYIDKTPHMGSDEAGKGDFFGPLCVAAVYADSEGISRLLKLGIKDNKKLSDKKAMEFAKIIREEFKHHIVRINPEKYNELYSKFKNLNHLLAWGHATVLEQLSKDVDCDFAMIDKFASESLISNAVKRKSSHLNLKIFPRAEEDVVVAAAAILARVAFLNGLENLGQIIDLELPKGASNLTKTAARKILKLHGAEGLQKVCKKHFQTYQEILDSPDE